jgi:putative ABC transport system permease protein
MMIEQLWQDIRYACRAFLRMPGLAAIAVLTMAIGVGANAAIFSVVYATLLRPLPYPDAGGLVLVGQVNRQSRQGSGDATPANFLDWRARSQSFTGMSGVRETNVVLADGDLPERRRAAMVNANFFEVLRVSPSLGRAFIPSDEGRGAPRVAVISNALWRERFAGRPDIVNQTARFDDELYTIVGVMPAGVEYPGRAEVWVTPHWPVPDDPLLAPGTDPSLERGHGYFEVLARLAPGVSLDAASADMDVVAASLERDYPDDNRNSTVKLVPLRNDLVVGDVRAVALQLFAAVGLLLLIATANVSGLLMARATARRQEIALRVALGATRSRILVQLLTESVLLSVAGGAAGVLVALWLVPGLVALSPADLNAAGAVTVDRTVLAFGLAISTVSGLLFGLAPARQLVTLNVNDDLKQSAHGVPGAGPTRLRAVIVAGEIALSLVLLVAAGLTVRSFVRLQHVRSGFEPDGVLTFLVAPAGSRYGTQSERADFWEHTVRAMQAIPGVKLAGATSRLPLLPGNSTRGLMIRGLPPDADAVADYRTASPDYFAAMSIPVLSGRVFDDGDREGRPVVALVSAAAASRYWPGRDAIGQHFLINDPGPEYTVVGVVGDVHSASLERVPRPTVYVPYRQDAFPFMTIVLKTSMPASAVASLVRAAMRDVDRAQPTGAVLTMDEQLSRSLTRRRFSVMLLSLFGAVAALLAAVGLYGVLAFVVSERRREIGVRLALGATARDVIVDVVGQGLRLAGLGIAVGVGLALVAARLMAALLYGTSPTDVVTFVGAATLLALVAVGASFIPALRASRVDPLVALREE